jgi:hypothetical protein
MATRCCWPPESWGRKVPGTFGEADQSQRLGGALRPLHLVDLRIERRQLHILERARARKEIEALEDETELAVADAGQLPLIEAGDVDSLEQVTPGSRTVETAEDVHERRLSAAARSHDGDERARLHGNVDPAECVQARLAELVILVNLLDLDDCHAHRRTPWTPGGPDLEVMALVTTSSPGFTAPRSTFRTSV